MCRMDRMKAREETKHVFILFILAILQSWVWREKKTG
jgi:hypothetical protein